MLLVVLVRHRWRACQVQILGVRDTEGLIDGADRRRQVRQQIAGSRCGIRRQTRKDRAVKSTYRIASLSKGRERSETWIAETFRHRIAKFDAAFKGMLPMRPAQIVTDRVQRADVRTPRAKPAVLDEPRP